MRIRLRFADASNITRLEYPHIWRKAVRLAQILTVLLDGSIYAPI